MNYSRFEKWAFAGTTLLVAITIVVSAPNWQFDPIEVVGQLIIIVVMAAALHWGHKAGTIAALGACLLYVLLRLPDLSEGLSTTALILVCTRFAGYGLIGIVGGEVFVRVKYLLAANSHNGVIDDWSQVYNQRYAARALAQTLTRHERYKEPYSVVVIRIDADALRQSSATKLKSTVRMIAGLLRDDVRMVDDVARLDDGGFVIMLPHTPGTAAPVVADRLTNGICRALNVNAASISTTCLGAEEDTAAFTDFVASLQPPSDDAPANTLAGASA